MKYTNKGLKTIAINSTAIHELPHLQAYINKNHLSNWIHVSINKGYKNSDVLIAKGFFENYEGLGVPRTVVIDKNGKLIYKTFGYTSEEMKILESVIERAVNEGP